MTWRLTHNLSIIIFLLILLCPAIAFSTEFSVGVSPPVVEIGGMERGSSKIVKFHLVTVSSDPLLVHMTPLNGNLDFFSSNKYKNLIYNVSEENTAAWLTIFNNPVELTPSGKAIAGSNIKAWKEITLLLSVPDDADPGYHVVSVKPAPYVPEGTSGGVGAVMVAVTSVNFLFNVKGSSVREGIILDIVNGGYIRGGIKLDTYFKNTGTTTISAIAHHKIYNKNGELVAEGYSPIVYIKPKETRVFEARIRESIPLGEYDVFTSVDYTTGKSEMNSTLSLERPVYPAVVAKGPEPSLLPWILIILIIIIISIVIYRWNR